MKLQLSLRTKDEGEAKTLLNAKNESFRQPILNMQIARTYMAAADPMVSKRIWQSPMDEMTRTKTGPTRIRHERAMMDTAFDSIRNRPIVETNSGHFLEVLAAGTVATNVLLRRIHNLALDMGWLPWPVLPKRQWPKVEYGAKRAITFEEHRRIVDREQNPERKAFYQLCWFLGGSQGDIADLHAEDIDSWLEFRKALARIQSESGKVVEKVDIGEVTFTAEPGEGIGVEAYTPEGVLHKQVYYLPEEDVFAHVSAEVEAQSSKGKDVPKDVLQRAIGELFVDYYKKHYTTPPVVAPDIADPELVPIPGKMRRPRPAKPKAPAQAREETYGEACLEELPFATPEAGGSTGSGWDWAVDH